MKQKKIKYFYDQSMSLPWDSFDSCLIVGLLFLPLNQQILGKMTDSVNFNLSGPLTLERFNALMDRFSDDLFLFVRGIVDNAESSEEIVSDVFLKIWNKRVDFQEINNVRSFLFIMARNESISFLRKNKNIQTLSLDEVNEYNFLPLESDGSELFDQEVIDKVNMAIEQLPAKCKMAFCLAKINGLKYKEIAGIMEISPLTVKNHIAYALEKITTQVGGLGKDYKINCSDILLFFVSKRNGKVK